MNIIQAMSDEKLFAPWFKRESWNPWKAFLSGLFALPMNEEQAEIFKRHTGRSVIPQKAATEAWLIVGRRGGKSLISALVAVFLACFRDYQEFLAPGEVATIPVIAPDRRQARTVMRYIRGFIDSNAMLAAMVSRRTRESIEFSCRTVVEVHVCNFRTVRGYTLAGLIGDEVAFWRSEESANPDTEILNGLRPGMATIPGALLVCISSPYARRGALWEAHKKHYGKENDRVLVWQADTRSMNPAVSEEVITDAYEADEASAAAEYGAQFRRDIETFVPRETVDAVVIPDRRELPFSSVHRYAAFVDPSGGSQDSMTLAIAHREGNKGVLDVIRERKPPFSPDQVTEEFSTLLKQYGIGHVRGDHYGGEWPKERFFKHGIQYLPAEMTKSDFYREMLPFLNAARLELLDEPRLISQLCSLERRTARAGRDSIDHAPGSHDDVINAAAGALVEAMQGTGDYGILIGDYSGPKRDNTRPEQDPKRDDKRVIQREWGGIQCDIKI